MATQTSILAAKREWTTKRNRYFYIGSFFIYTAYLYGKKILQWIGDHRSFDIIRIIRFDFSFALPPFLSGYIVLNPRRMS